MLTGKTDEVLELQGGRSDFQSYAKANLPRKIQALLDQKDFQPKISWIAKKLGASLDDVQKGLDLLESLGLITWDNGLIAKKEDHTVIAQHLRGRTKSQLVSDHRIISHQLLNDVDSNQRFFVQNGFISSDEETLRSYYEKILQVEQWFKEASQKSKNNIVVGYSFTGANILKYNNEETLK